MHMGKKCRAIICGMVLLAGMIRPVWAEESRFGQPEFTVNCKAALLMDQDSGAVLYAANPDIQLPEASITKVMTLLLTMEALEEGRVGLEDIVPVSEHSYSMGGSQIWLEPGEQFTLDEMLRAICVSSANDAAVAVAEYIGGSEEVFVEQMNGKAAELGLINTHYRNACGLDAAGHVSSARDVAVLSREILNHYPLVLEYSGIWMDSLRDGQTQLVNTNKLLKSYPGITGLKTGTTGGAGVCITASAERDGLRLIAVVLGAPSSQERFAAAKTLLDYGFANFANREAPLPEDAPEQIGVAGGTAGEVPLRYERPAGILLRKGEENLLSAVLELPENLQAPVTAGRQVGTVHLSVDGEEIGDYAVCAAGNVPDLDLRAALKKLIAELAHG